MHNFINKSKSDIIFFYESVIVSVIIVMIFLDSSKNNLSISVICTLEEV